MAAAGTGAVSCWALGTMEATLLCVWMVFLACCLRCLRTLAAHGGWRCTLHVPPDVITCRQTHRISRLTVCAASRFAWSMPMTGTHLKPEAGWAATAASVVVPCSDLTHAAPLMVGGLPPCCRRPVHARQLLRALRCQPSGVLRWGQLHADLPERVWLGRHQLRRTPHLCLPSQA
jgi:hypothetical protein